MKKIGELGSTAIDPQLDTTDMPFEDTPVTQNIQGGGSDQPNTIQVKAKSDPVDDVLKWITNNSNNAIVRGWIDKVEPLNDADRIVVMMAVKGKTNANLTLLKQQLTDASKVWNKAAVKKKNQQISAIRQKKKIVEIKYAPADTRGVTLEAAMALVNDSDPNRDKIFRYGSALVRIQADHPTTVQAVKQLNSTNINYPEIPVVKVYDRIATRHRLEQCAVYIIKDGKGNIKKPWPNDIIDGISTQNEVKFPPLTGIIQHPFVGSSGNLITQQGYDMSTGLYVQYADELNKGLIETPTKKDTDKALKFLCDKVYEDFPFVDKIDKIATVSAMLTALQRKMIADDSGCPGFLFDAPTQGTGKTTVVQIISYAIFGRSVAASSWCDKDTEMAKLLLSILLEGHGCVLFDNLPVGTRLESNELAKAMTGNSYSGRVLGKNQTATVPSNTVWLFTGNNIVISGDFNTRIIPIRLDSRCADPDRRTFSRTDIGSWCLNYRAEIIKACLVLVKADCSQLSKDVKPTRYPDWDKYVRLPLLAASGIDVADKFQQNKQADPDIEVRLNFLDAMFKECGSSGVTAVDLLHSSSSLRSCIADIFAPDTPSAQRFGKWLGGMKGQVLGGYRLTSSKGTSGEAKNRTIWIVEKTK